ncbi:hypothetical protein ACT2CV_08690 [Pasteurellaceae bacterium 22721_9_1]
MDSTVYSEGAGVFGANNTVDPNAGTSYAVGTNNTLNAENTYVFGQNVETKYANGVILGTDSTDENKTREYGATVNGITYGEQAEGDANAFAGNNPTGVISVGAAGKERQIKNVAAGKIAAESTDAINGSQLYLTQNALDNLASSTANHLGGNSAVNSDGSLTAPTYNLTVENPTAGNNDALTTTANNVGDALTNLNTYVNQGFRVLDNGGVLKGTVTPGEAVQFVNGKNTVANVTTEANGVTKVTFDLDITAGEVVSSNEYNVKDDPNTYVKIGDQYYTRMILIRQLVSQKTMCSQKI